MNLTIQDPSLQKFQSSNKILLRELDIYAEIYSKKKEKEIHLIIPNRLMTSEKNRMQGRVSRGIQLTWLLPWRKRGES